MESKKYTLVLGVPRSGTTLLTTILGSHEECIALNESRQMQEYRVVSPCKFIVNKLVVPNQIQIEHNAPRTWRLLNDKLKSVWEKISRKINGPVIRDSSVVPLSIESCVQKRDAKLILIIRNPNQIVDSMIRRGGLREKKAISR